MKEQVSFKEKMRLLFIAMCAIFIVSELTAILGTLGIGSSVLHIIFHSILLVVIIIVATKGYQFLAKNLIEPIVELDHAVVSMSKGDLSTEIAYEGESELGVLAESLRKTLDMLKKLVMDFTYILKQFQEGNFNVNSEHPEAYIGDFSELLERLVQMVGSFSDTMRGIDNAADQVSEGANGLAMSAQDLAQGASDQAASIQELLATVTEVTEQVVENTKTTDKAHD